MVVNKFEKIFDKFTNHKQINKGILFIENANGDFSFYKGYGGMELDSPLLAASITKLFTTACILIFLEHGKLSLQDKIINYFDNSLLNGIHVYRGRDFTPELTISDLLFQVSGLPDIYEEGKNSAKARVINEDFYITFEEIIAWEKRLKPHFAPHSKAKAFYADINFDILGEIIEKVSNLTLSKAYKQYIFEPLGLSNSYLPESEKDFIPVIYYRNKVIHRPRFVLSSRASGGCITSANDLMTFIKAFYGGRLFNKAVFNGLPTSNRLQASFGPVCYGGGFMRIPLNGMHTLFMGKGELIGHSGSTGSFAFYYPTKDLFFVGDLNQMANSALPVRLSMQLAMASN
jgi:CubicO group peptidase (beta-lactamase class C family)